MKLTDSNVKTAAAAKKPKTSAVPPVAIMAIGAAMQDGADKYGLFNWRETQVSATVFYDAMMRHLNAWYNGENFALDSGIHHLAHLMAGAAIVLDATEQQVFNDDRPKSNPIVMQQEQVYRCNPAIKLKDTQAGNTCGPDEAFK